MALKTNTAEYVLDLKNISKIFPGVKAIEKVNFNLCAGEVHALIGENGAGKSTIVKIIAGIYQQDEGSIFINNQEVKFHSPIDSNAKGIRVVYQELNLVSELSVAENIFLGAFPAANRLGIIKWKIMREKAKDILSKLGLEIDPTIKVGSLRVAEQQIVEIARSISRGAKIIIMDEPTSALSPLECKNLFELINNLKNHDVSIIYVTHKLQEIYELADRVTVLRDGKHIVTKDVKDTTIEELIYYMIGRKLTDIFPKTIRKSKEVMLSVRKIDSLGIKNISFDLYSGEVLGIFGLLGSKKEKLARVIYGIDPITNGEIYINGKKIRDNSPYIAMNSGIGLITENRREEGIIPLLSVKRNMTVSSLNALSNKGWLFNQRERSVAETYVKRLNIKTPSLSKEIMYLSGGNQQKVILARWMIHKQKVLIISEPTRGIDVGSKAEIHKIIDEMANLGLAILMISSEIEEIIGISDRIIVMYEGTITKEFTREEATKEKLMIASVGGVN